MFSFKTLIRTNNIVFISHEKGSPVKPVIKLEPCWFYHTKSRLISDTPVGRADYNNTVIILHQFCYLHFKSDLSDKLYTIYLKILSV